MQQDVETASWKKLRTILDESAEKYYLRKTCKTKWIMEKNAKAGARKADMTKGITNAKKLKKAKYTSADGMDKKIKALTGTERCTLNGCMEDKDG